MTGVNPDNERIKRRYFHHLREAQGLAEVTVDHAQRALAEYELFTAYKAFKHFSTKDAIAFRKALLAGPGKRSAQLSSRATVHTKLTQSQKFFHWLAGQPGFKKQITYADVEYFRLPTRERKIALERREKPTPALEQVQHVVRSMPADTDMAKRNRALVACVLLTGIRVSALITLKLKHVRDDRLGINQDAREVRTKFAKSQQTFFFDVGDDIRETFLSYVDHLRNVRLWADEDPLFPATRLSVGSAHKFERTGLQRAHWKTADPVREIFRKSFAAAGIPHYSPHSIRRTLTRLAERTCTSPEELKAWSQNLGHDEVLTTLISYGFVPPHRQAELICNPARKAIALSPDEQLKRLLKQLGWTPGEQTSRVDDAQS